MVGVVGGERILTGIVRSDSHWPDCWGNSGDIKRQHEMFTSQNKSGVYHDFAINPHSYVKP